MTIDRRVVWGVSTALTLAIVGVTVIYVHLYGITVPFLDMWTFEVDLVLSVVDGRFELTDLWQFQDAHPLPVPLSVVAMNVAFDSSWNIANQLYVAITVYATTLLILLDISRRQHSHTLLCVMLVMALLVFNLRQHDNIVWAFTALQWSMQLLWVAFAAWGLVALQSDFGGLIWLMLVVALANLTSAAGLVLLIAVSTCSWFLSVALAALPSLGSIRLWGVTFL